MSQSRPTMALSDHAYPILMDLIRNRFLTEISFYARNDVSVTSHAVGEPDISSWTTELLRRGILTQGPDSKKGDRFVELERTLTVMYCFLLLLKGDNLAYQSFVSAQRCSDEIPESDVLTRENFDILSARLRNAIGTDKDKHNVLLYLIIYSDLGKSPRIKELLAPYPQINLAQDSDGLMTDILKLTDKQITEILPSFALLSARAKEMLKETYPIMNACQGHIFFLERGEKTFQVIANALLNIPVVNRENALELVNLSQFLDAVGAQGQRYIFGGFNCTNVYAKGYQLVDKVLHNMRQRLTSEQPLEEVIEDSFEDYLAARASWLGFIKSEENVTSTKALLTRLGCSLRGMTPEYGNKIIEQYEKFEPYHGLIETQLGFGPDGLESWKAAVHYIATTMLNMSRELTAKANIAFKKGDLSEGDRLLSEAIFEALKGTTCFSMVLQHIATNYQEYILDPTRAISFWAVANDANANPKAFNPVTFNPRTYALDITTNKVAKSTFFTSRDNAETASQDAKTAEIMSPTPSI